MSGDEPCANAPSEGNECAAGPASPPSAPPLSSDVAALIELARQQASLLRSMMELLSSQNQRKADDPEVDDDGPPKALGAKRGSVGG